MGDFSEIKEAKFLSSVDHFKKAPKETLPEYAFIGRSNVGKSSLLNMLTGRKNLAKVSGTPGKTQTINHFLIDDSYYIADLPGYGYAKVSKVAREKFSNMISQFLINRRNLMCVMVLVDSRLPLQQIDDEFMRWLGEKEVPFVIVFTKTDKLSSTQLEQNMKEYERAMLRWWEIMPQFILTSSEKKLGREELLRFFATYNSQFQLPPPLS